MVIFLTCHFDNLKRAHSVFWVFFHRFDNLKRAHSVFWVFFHRYRVFSSWLFHQHTHSCRSHAPYRPYITPHATVAHSRQNTHPHTQRWKKTHPHAQRWRWTYSVPHRSSVCGHFRLAPSWKTSYRSLAPKLKSDFLLILAIWVIDILNWPSCQHEHTLLY